MLTVQVSGEVCLLTGDSEGYIKVWDIETFCLDEEQLVAVTGTAGYLDTKSRKYSQFVFLKSDLSRVSRKNSRRSR